MQNIWQKTDRFLTVPLLIGLICLFLILAPFLIFYQQLPTELPLHYSLPWGQAQLVNRQQFLTLPGVLIAINLFNCLLASQIHPGQVLLRRTLSLSLIMINLIILIAALQIMFIFI